MTARQRIAVIGAGIVGCSCALWLQREGFAVTLIDQDEPGAGTSSGNAGTIADYGCVPVNSPALLKRLPALMLARHSPLALNLGYAMTHPRWMLQFLNHCREVEVTRITALLGSLLRHTYAGLDPLLDMAQARDLIRQNGCMYVYQSETEYQQALGANRARREQGFDYVELSAADIRELEPALKLPFERGLLFEAASHVINPRALCERYRDCLEQNGGEFLRQRVVDIEARADNVQIRLDNGGHLQTGQLVISAGAFSRNIAGAGLKNLPLDTERGYHIEFDDCTEQLSRPVAWNAAGFYATPMQQGMRFAGTVEIAGYSNRRNPRNLAFLKRKASEMLPVSGQPDREWLGFRPTLPDSLPVIGHSTLSTRVLLAFGHQHIGLTLAGITGKLIAGLAAGNQPDLDLKPFSPRRFS